MLIFNLLFGKSPIIVGYSVTRVYYKKIPHKVEIIHNQSIHGIIMRKS